MVGGKTDGGIGPMDVSVNTISSRFSVFVPSSAAIGFAVPRTHMRSEMGDDDDDDEDPSPSLPKIILL